jgi:hypothetical protein
MSKFTQNLWSDLVQEHGPAIANASRPGPGRVRRPRLIAGSTLVLAGAGTALALLLTATGSTPAFAVTKTADGSVLVQINQTTSLPAANHKLTAMGIHEQVTIDIQAGAAAASGPVTCTSAPGVSGPALKVLLGSDGTETIAAGSTGDNTGVGTWHVASCTATGDPGSGGTGSGGTGNTGAG